ncbi:MAG: hypothetical protein HC815_32780 [Richelia sp. RM1_1_1]|nr:hypothetical protein [Richelia sp. RM1_1_1]
MVITRGQDLTCSLSFNFILIVITKKAVGTKPSLRSGAAVGRNIKT